VALGLLGPLPETDPRAPTVLVDELDARRLKCVSKGAHRRSIGRYATGPPTFRWSATTRVMPVQNQAAFNTEERARRVPARL